MGAVFRLLPRFFLFVLFLTAYAVFCWGVFVSPDSRYFVACFALALGILNFVATTALWVFYLSKHFSTHRIKVLDIKKTAHQRRPVESTAALDDDDLEDENEKKARDFADTATAKMFNRTKENFSNSGNGGGLF